MSNYESFLGRISKAQTVADCDKLDQSLERLYNAGIFSVDEFRRLDLKLLDRLIEIQG